MTALHYACKKSYIELIKFLVDSKADLEAKDSVGRTPLFYALLTEDMECVKVFFLFKISFFYFLSIFKVITH